MSMNIYEQRVARMGVLEARGMLARGFEIEPLIKQVTTLFPKNEKISISSQIT